MSLRYIVFEAFCDNGHVAIQMLNLHQSVSAAYWHYPPNHERLHIIDIKTGQTHSWQECETMMLCEQLQRIEANKPIEQTIAPAIRKALFASGYIGSDGLISSKGREFLAQYVKPELIIHLPYLKSESKLYLRD